MNALLRLVRAAATAPALPPAHDVRAAPADQLCPARVARPRTAALRPERAPPPLRTATYRLRESSVAIALRHHTGDVMVLDEIFSQREYEPPPEVDLGGVETAVDLGANIGLFGAWLLGRAPRPGSPRIEPDPGNAAVHRLALEANGLGERWRLVEAFAGTAAGTTTFTAGLHATSHEGAGIEVPVVDVLPELARAELIKVDVEGAEWPILADPRFRELAASWLVLEYHADGCPSADPRAAAEEALRAAGFEVVHTQRKPAFGAGLSGATAAPRASRDPPRSRASSRSSSPPPLARCAASAPAGARCGWYSSTSARGAEPGKRSSASIAHSPPSMSTFARSVAASSPSASTARTGSPPSSILETVNEPAAKGTSPSKVVAAASTTSQPRPFAERVRASSSRFAGSGSTATTRAPGQRDEAKSAKKPTFAPRSRMRSSRPARSSSFATAAGGSY